MTTAYSQTLPTPLHSILLAFPLVLFASAVITDIAYLRSAEIQWSNFSAWLIAGGLFTGAFVLLWAVIAFFTNRQQSSRGRPLTYLLLLVAMWVIGFINALLHSRDAGYSVTPTALLLSVVVALLALVAAWIGYSGFIRREAP
jgi:uncharacterized membrane protein